MNYTLQLHGERMLYPTPPGLYELMSDMTREVLRDQPGQVYEYIARYLDTLVRVRQTARSGEEVVSDVLQETSELLAYVRSLGASWSEANTAASKVQRAFHTFKCRQELKRQIKLREQMLRRSSSPSGSCSQSFLDYLESLGVDLEKADRAASIIQQAYNTYRAKKLETSTTKDVSTHTIDEIQLKPYGTAKKPYKRDSKLLVYQQSPRQSDESTWSTLVRDMDEEKANLWRKSSMGKYGEVSQGKPFTLVYEQDKSLSNYKYVPTQLKSDFTTVPAGRVSLPSYYNEYAEKIPMISESGLLLHEEVEEAVTLFSSDSVDDDVRKRSRASTVVPYLTVGNLEFGPKNEEMAKELFEIIGRASSSSKTERSSSDKKSDSKPASIMKRAASGVSTTEVPTDQKKATILKIPLTKGSLRGSVGRPSVKLRGSGTLAKDDTHEEPRGNAPSKRSSLTAPKDDNP